MIAAILETYLAIGAVAALFYLIINFSLAWKPRLWGSIQLILAWPGLFLYWYWKVKLAKQQK